MGPVIFFILGITEGIEDPHFQARFVAKTDEFMGRAFLTRTHYWAKP